MKDYKYTYVTSGLVFTNEQAQDRSGCYQMSYGEVRQLSAPGFWQAVKGLPTIFVTISNYIYPVMGDSCQK